MSSIPKSKVKNIIMAANLDKCTSYTDAKLKLISKLRKAKYPVVMRESLEDDGVDLLVSDSIAIIYEDNPTEDTLSKLQSRASKRVSRGEGVIIVLSHVALALYDLIPKTTKEVMVVKC